MDNQAVIKAFEQKRNLAVADQVLIDPAPGKLVPRVEELIKAIATHGKSPEQIGNTLIRLGMNFVGRDAEIVGYRPDEIDAALDETNIDRFTRVLQEFIRMSQFILITHNKKAIQMADVLYGITMAEKGISKIVSVRFADSDKKTDKEEIMV